MRDRAFADGTLAISSPVGHRLTHEAALQRQHLEVRLSQLHLELTFPFITVATSAAGFLAQRFASTLEGPKESAVRLMRKM
jgi:hypothetical protein